MLAIANWPTKRSSWLLLAVSALIFELTALYFQYEMKLEPCIMCIYQRVAIFGILLSAVFAAIAPNLLLMRLVGFIGWATGAIWGAIIALEHVAIQMSTDPFGAVCERTTNFPSFMPLHHWLPDVFEARGDCGTIDWQFFDHSMPQWMIVVFAGYAIICFTVILIRLAGAKKL